MKQDKLNHFSINIDRKIEDLDNARRTLSDFLKGNNINDENISRIELSTYEALVNIIDHSSLHYKEQDICIDCDITENSVKVIISNYGDEFDIRNIKLPNIEEHYKSGGKRGLGIYFIRTLMDQVEYIYKDNVNILTLIKNINS